MKTGGIVFLASKRLDEIVDFYRNRVGCSIWLRQADCVVLQHGNLLVGFCQRERVDTQGLLCFVYDNREEVDRMYGEFKAEAESEPVANPKYEIYHFFAKDPEGRTVEFQSFDNAPEMP